MQYPTETFTDAERELLSRHCTNLDRPVFALTNLPETLKGALFARYSRYPGTLRRLLLDEFASDLPDAPGPAAVPASAIPISSPALIWRGRGLAEASRPETRRSMR